MAKVSFIVLSYNDSEMVHNAVGSIKKIKTTHEIDIFVVDNGSRKDELSALKRKAKGAKIIHLPKNIGTAAYDAALSKSKAEYIYFTGCDVEFKEDMLDVLVDILEKDRSAAQAAPKYLGLDDKSKVDIGGTYLSRSFYSGTFKDDRLGGQIQQIPYMGTGLLRRSVIDEWGYLFDNDYFFYGEDVDLGMRIRLMGQKIYYAPSSIVYHKGSISRKIHRQEFLAFLMERNLMRTYFTTLSFWNILLYLPYMLVMRDIAMFRDLFKRKYPNALARLKAMAWIALNPSKILKKRREVQKRRKVSDSALFEWFSEKPLFKK